MNTLLGRVTIRVDASTRHHGRHVLHDFVGRIRGRAVSGEGGETGNVNVIMAGGSDMDEHGAEGMGRVVRISEIGTWEG